MPSLTPLARHAAIIRSHEARSSAIGFSHRIDVVAAARAHGPLEQVDLVGRHKLPQDPRIEDDARGRWLALGLEQAQDQGAVRLRFLDTSAGTSSPLLRS